MFSWRSRPRNVSEKHLGPPLTSGGTPRRVVTGSRFGLYAEAGELSILLLDIRNGVWLVARFRIRYARLAMGETLLNAAVAVGILGLALLLTEVFTRQMYYRCRQCGALNAKRRSQCRSCGEALP